MPDEGNLDPGCSRLHHDEYEASGGLITHLQSLNSQSNGRGEGGAPGRGVCEERERYQGRLLCSEGVHQW